MNYLLLCKFDSLQHHLGYFQVALGRCWIVTSDAVEASVVVCTGSQEVREHQKNFSFRHEWVGRCLPIQAPSVAMSVIMSLVPALKADATKIEKSDSKNNGFENYEDEEIG